jgi:hypothetical protein
LTSPVPVGKDHDFTRILAILPGPDGSAVIADAGNHEIHAFDRAGTHTRSIGSRGQGPGEFERLRRVGSLGDTVWVIASGVPHTTLFSRDGRVLGTIRKEESASMTALVAGGALGTGAGSPLGSANAFRDERLPVVLMTRAGRSTDTVAWVPSRNSNFAIGPRSDGSYTIGSQRFSDAGLTITTPDGSAFFVVDRSVALEPRKAVFRVTSLRANGDTLWSRTYEYVPKRFEKARGDSLVNAYSTDRRRSRNTPEEIRNALFIPQYYIPVTAGFAGSDGSLWLRREEDPAAVDYWVIGRDGRLIATVAGPPELTLMAATASEAWGVRKDEYDVPTVVRYRIQR